MSDKKLEKNDGYSLKKAASYATGQIADQGAYQTFTFLVFTFYYAVVQLNILLITLGFIIWAFWNSFNDPMLGYLSDRTHTKYGRRLPYIMISIIPLGLILFFLFTPPLPIGVAYQIGNFIYFMVIIIVFEFFYTMFSLNSTSLFPETFISEEERTSANNVRQGFLILGLIVAFILPGVFISDYTPDPGDSAAINAAVGEYQLFGIIAAIIIIVIGGIFIKFTPREKKEFKEDYKIAPSFFNSIKMCVKSKSFMWYIPAEIANWFVYGILPTLIPLYAKAVLNIVDPLMISLLMGAAFISSVIFITFVWKPIVRRIGNRKAWMISMTSWIITLFPLMFLGPNMEILAITVFFFIGLGLSGSFYIIDLIVSDIIDEDEINTGIRREAGYYGVNAFFLRLAIIIVFLSIGPMFIIADWEVFTLPASIEVQMGLRILMFVYPAVALIIAILSIYKYPLHGKRLEEVKEKLKDLHAQKKAKV
ncbi:MAG: MFS transporter [Candidatus Lokiarchaeota archaeon]|nr:MFS transporter [Candidatus Lokiarchaeota archaeon]